MNTLRSDILILGAGPAGMAAATITPPLADKSGARVRRQRCPPWPGATATPSPRLPPSG